jgi:hypothetical protein
MKLTAEDLEQRDFLDEDCFSCEEDCDPNNPIDYDNYKCSKSKRECGHHCNHVWTHEECCWCGMEFGETEDSPEVELGRQVGH